MKLMKKTLTTALWSSRQTVCGGSFRPAFTAMVVTIAAVVQHISSAQYIDTAITPPPGYVQLQGDIITTTNDAAVLLGKTSGTKQSGPLIAYAPSRLWPNGVVPYIFDASVAAAQLTNSGPVSIESTIQQAMGWWQNSFPGATTVTFQPCRQCQGGYLVLKVVSPGFKGGSTDYVGYKGSPVTITLHPDIFTNGASPVGLIAHEMAHALGVWHEQSRNDRAPFITVVTNNIQSGQLPQFDPASPQATFGPYDYDSVMHYSPCSFSTCVNPQGQPNCSCPSTGCETLRVPIQYTNQQCNIGQRSHLSAMDQRVMAFRYAPPGWKFLYAAANSTGSGAFEQPYTLVSQANSFAPPNALLWIGPGQYSAAGQTLTTPMTLTAAIPDLQMQANGSLGPSPSGLATLR